MIISIIFSFLFGIVLGACLIPLVLFLRGRRSGWDNSNFTNILRVLAHLATHPNDFLYMQFPDGKKPFWYLDKDEFSEVVKTRPSEKEGE